jgi:hypothetical protein
LCGTALTPSTSLKTKLGRLSPKKVWNLYGRLTDNWKLRVYLRSLFLMKEKLSTRMPWPQQPQPSCTTRLRMTPHFEALRASLVDRDNRVRVVSPEKMVRTAQTVLGAKTGKMDGV